MLLPAVSLQNIYDYPKNISAMLWCCYLDCKFSASITNVVQVVKSMVSR